MTIDIAKTKSLKDDMLTIEVLIMHAKRVVAMDETHSGKLADKCLDVIRSGNRQIRTLTKLIYELPVGEPPLPGVIPETAKKK